MNRRTIPLLLLVWTLVLAVVTWQMLLPATVVTAQAMKAGPKWEYACLVAGDTAADLHWQAGESIRISKGSVVKPDFDRSVRDMVRHFGGKEENATLGTLLNAIGHDGWELVSYVRPPGAQTWMFKRARS